MHGDGGCVESQSLVPDMPPYQMNCGQTEAAAIETLSSLYYDGHPSFSRESAAIAIAMSEPPEIVGCGSTSSTDDFDFDQSYRRLVQNAETLRGDAGFQPVAAVILYFNVLLQSRAIYYLINLNLPLTFMTLVGG